MEHPAEKIWPFRFAMKAGLAFLAGSLGPLLLFLIMPFAIRGEVTLVVVAISLTISGWIGARSEHGNPWISIARTVAIGLVTLGISSLAGSLVTFGTDGSEPAHGCARWDLNPHVRRHRNLNPARIPISPLARARQPDDRRRDQATLRSRLSFATWPVARTLYWASVSFPSGATTNVERITPVTVLPYIIFSPHAP